MALDDLTGQRFGRLVVISRAPNHVCPGGSYSVVWNCVCDCGNRVQVLANSLRNGNNKSCGCYRRDKRTRHRRTHTRLYNIWENMKQRCRNPNNRQYADYGGRGICVCDEWLNFEVFYQWALSNGYNDSLSIDRIDNDKGYTPDNCRWTDATTQANNRRFCWYITYNGETRTASQWAEIAGISADLFRGRLYRGWSVERALSTPIGR